MRKVIASVLFLAASSVAVAACPSYAPYGCVQQANGKMKCGCGVR